MDFKEVKTVKLTDVVVGKYHCGLRFKGEYAKCPCPLPTHKKGDRNANFTIHIPSNTWRCFSDSCIAESKLDGKSQDVITFVRIMEGMRRPIEAAQKLAEWYGLNGNEKPAPRIEKRAVQEVKSTPLPNIQDNKPASGSVKLGYMQAVGLWLDTFIVRRPDETDDAYYKRLKKGFMSQLHQSFLNGKKGQEELVV